MNHTLSLFAALFLLAVAGCGGSSKSAVITEPPNDWSTLAGKSQTFEGRAGNSPKGPLLRLEDGSIVGLSNFRMWPVTYVGRPAGIVGTVTVGEGQRNGEYVVQVERWYLVKEPVQTPPAPAVAEPEPKPKSSPKPRPKKPKVPSKAL